MQWLWSPKTNETDLLRRQQLQSEEFGVESWDTPLLDAEYFVIDMETSGFSPHTDLVLSIAAASVNLNETPPMADMYHQLIAQGDVSHVPHHIWELTGLSPEALQHEGCDWREVLYTVLQMAAQRVWIAHHARHELSFLQKSTREFWKLRIQPIVIDTALVAQALLRTPAAPSLEQVCDWLEIRQSRRHHADDDVHMTSLVWQQEAQLCHGQGLRTVGEVIEWVRLRASG